jgi:hypothetical protein
MISTRKVWLQHAPEWFLRTEYDFHTQNVNLARMSLIFTRRVWNRQARVWFYIQSAISTRRMWFWHARVWFLHARCDFNTNDSDIYTQYARVWFPDVWVCLQHAQVWFLHTECDLHTQNLILARMNEIVCIQSEISARTSVIFKYDFNTQESDLYTQSMITTRTSVISICMSVIPTRKVWFSHTKYDLYTQRVI